MVSCFPQGFYFCIKTQKLRYYLFIVQESKLKTVAELGCIWTQKTVLFPLSSDTHNSQ